MFKTLIHGGTREEAEAAMQAVESLDAPKTPEEAIALISRLRAVADNIDSRNSCEENVISKYFGIECESYGFPTKVPILDDILKDFGHLLPGKSFVDLFVIAFYSMEANYQVALDAVGYLADSESQMQIADAFMKAGTYYDAGHRAEDNTVHDQLIDICFPCFNNDALIYLLEICDTQYLAADGMAQLFTVLLKRDPAEDIKRRAYDCLVAMYEKEGVTDYYYYRFQILFAELAPLLPEDVLKKIEVVNPDMWGKFELGNLSSSGTGKEIGFTDILIKRDCDYAFYVHRDKMQEKFDLMIFCPDGVMKNIDIYQPVSKAAIMEWYGEFGNVTWTATQQYAFWSGDKQVHGTEQGNRIETSGGRWTYRGGFNENGELILTVTCGEYHIGIYTYQHAGFSKSGELVFEGCFDTRDGEDSPTAQANADTKTDSARTLIPPECDYSVYAYYSEASLGYYCIGFYPDGKAISLNVSAIKAPHRFEPRKWFELMESNSAMEWSYSLCSGGERTDGTKQGDKLTVTIWGIHYTGGLNEFGELLLTTMSDGKELNYVYKYMGCVKGGQFISG